MSALGTLLAALLGLALALPAAAQSDFAKKFLAEQREEAFKALAKGKPLEQVKAARLSLQFIPRQ